MHMHRIQKNGTEEFIYWAAMENRIDLWIWGEGEMYGMSNMETYITIYKRQPMGICCMAQETQIGALYQSRWVGWGGRWERG